MTWDQVPFYVVQIIIVVTSIFAAFQDWSIKKKNGMSNMTAEVVRGEASMTWLHVVYGAALSSAVVLITFATNIEKIKIWFLLLDFICITYACLFSSWFRNSVLFVLRNKISKD